MRARASRLADRLMSGASVTTNVSQRISRPLVHLPVPVTFNMSQLAPRYAIETLLTVCLLFVPLLRKLPSSKTESKLGLETISWKCEFEYLVAGSSPIMFAVYLP